MRIARPRSLPSLQSWFDVAMHLLSLFVSPDPVVVSLSCFPNIVVQGVDQDKTTKCARLQIALLTVSAFDYKIRSRGYRCHCSAKTYLRKILHNRRSKHLPMRV